MKSLDKSWKAYNVPKQELDLLPDVIPHVFLPKKTPERLQENLEDVELFLLHQFSISLNNVLSEHPFPQLDSVNFMFKKWTNIQPKMGELDHIENFCHEIKTLENNMTLPIYVRKQNCTVLLTKRLNTFEVATFRSSLPGEIIMSAVGSHSMVYPETMETIKNIQILESKDFARQLHELTVGSITIGLKKTTKNGQEFLKTRDVADPCLVMDWIVGLLVPDLSQNVSEGCFELLQIRKKIRDQVTFATNSSGSLPFRRCGMYMSLKVATQLKILENMGNNLLAAKYVYKLVMIRFLTFIAKQYSSQRIIDMDLASQVLAKLGNRVRKLERFKFEPSALSSSDELLETIAKLNENCLRCTQFVVYDLKTKMDSVWANTIASFETPKQEVKQKKGLKSSFHSGNLDKKPKSSHNTNNDLDHDMPALDSQIDNLKKVLSSSENINELGQENELKPVNRYLTLNSILSSSSNCYYNSNLANDERIWLHDVEYYIKYKCNPIDDGISDIYKMLSAYAAKAMKHYKDDPLGISQFFLVSAKGLELLDKLAMQKFPDLTDYAPEVNLSVFDCLLLPYQDDMELLDDLIIYFSSREQCAYKSLSQILGRSISPNSFSVIYAKKDPGMISLRDKILVDDEKEIESKYSEVERCRAVCIELQRKINSDTCKCEYELTGKRYRTKWGQWRDARRKISTCERCRLQSQLGNERKSVSWYERSLPNQEILQWAIVFELSIPEVFDIWRNFLAFFKYEVIGGSVFDGESNGKYAIKWLRHLESYSEKECLNLKLGSPSLPATYTYLTKTQDLDVLTSTNENYIINNGMGCIYHYKMVGTPTKCVQTACSFKLKDTSGSIPYENLQHVMSSTTHTQNSVIARQYDCHEKLSLSEYIAFGSIRAGHRIQLRNLYEAIFSGTISLKEEPVLALILQTIWQVGPRNLDKRRDAHLDFWDEIFAGEFLNMLDKLVKNNSGSYSNCPIVFMAVLIAHRIGDLNKNMQQKCYEISKQWRVVLAAWMKKVQEELDKLEVASAQRECSQLKQTLLEIILCSMLSYNVSKPSRFECVMKDEEDIIQWLHTIYQYNVTLNEGSVGFSNFMKQLLSFGKTISLRLQLEEKVAKNDSTFLNALKLFIPQIWTKAKGGVEFKGVTFPKESQKSSLIIIEYTEKNADQGKELNHFLTFDITNGSFLVNGYAQSTLPYNVAEDKLFRQYFKNATNLRVQQDSANITRTRAPYLGRHYEIHHCRRKNLSSRNYGRYLHAYQSFSYRDTWSLNYDSDEDRDYNYYRYSHNYHRENNVIIKEIQDDSSILILLDPETLSKCLPNFFIDNHSHWLDISKGLIYFRPNSDPAKSIILAYDYMMQKHQNGNKNVWRLQDVSSNDYILNIKSPGFHFSTLSLAKLELPEYIIVKSNRNQLRTAHLRRYNLRFFINEDGEHESVEYPDFIIHSNHQIKGTLIGLEHGLMLTDKNEKLCLIPHSNIQITNFKSNSHQTVMIDLGDLKQPPYFVYEFDDVLKRLKAHNSKSAWLYLAALHASTSSPLPDPFTEITGFEMAVGILQSACVWSGSPYDKESWDILNFIRSLAPKRKYYGKVSQSCQETLKDEKGNMEVIQWPEGLSSMAAYDGFRIIIDKLLMDSQKLSILYPNSQENFEKEEKQRSPTSSEKLCIRAYLRHLPIYNSLVLVEEPYFIPSQLQLIMSKSGSVEDVPSRQSSETFNLTNLLTISTTLHTKTISALIDKTLLQKDNLSAFLITPKSLATSLPKITLEENDSFRDLLQSNFRNNWLKLYEMAKSSKTPEEINSLSIILSAFAYRGAPMEQIANLIFISNFSSTGEIFPNLEPCDHENPTNNDYNVATVETILQCHIKEFKDIPLPIRPERNYSEGYSSYMERELKYSEELKEYVAKKKAYEDKIKANCTYVSLHIKNLIWPCNAIKEVELIDTVRKYLNSQNIESGLAMRKINAYLHIWFQNYSFKLFVDDLQKKLNQMFENTQSQSHEAVEIAVLSNGSSETRFENDKYCPLKMEELFDESLAKDPEEVHNIFKSGTFIPFEDSSFFELKTKFMRKVTYLTYDFKNMLNGSVYSKIIGETGIGPRFDPKSILKNIPLANVEEMSVNGRLIKEYSGALGVLWTHIKKVNRCLKANSQSELEREISNPGHQNWSPAEHPEWLLLELELDIMIRPVQVDVAKQMMSMPNERNGVTQLNMGEGKTSVIVPMLCATLAKKNSQLCRVTVLSSMFNMNLASLTFSIGGILNRRVYWIPCQRDLQIDYDCLSKVEESYKECLNLQGVVLTLPEYRLSFRLLAYDKLLKDNNNLGLKLHGIEKWLRYFARDILDESDELFSVKYQLVYTVGEHVPIDGGDIRWTTCQRILEIVNKKVGPKFMEDMQNKCGDDALEFNIVSNKPHEFSTFRLLSSSCFHEFNMQIADAFLEEVMILEDEKQIVKNFMIHQEIDRKDHLQVMQSIFKETPELLKKILIVSGYLKRGVLTLALTKRWRVEYGINPKQGFRRMAVPYRAKDVAAEKTEFGHPDLAIILTHLSYYYSGLSDVQLQETIEILKRKLTPDAIYSSWIAIIPDELMPMSLLNYKSLNMKDADQRRALFELLRKHKMVIDFWLKECVFPRECKQFPGKLVMTAWDLCYERHRHPVTGFSGTNDSKVLLPLMISQQDLPALSSTNEEMEKTLLQPENDNHKGFGMGVTCREILESMKADNLTVLIDAGALMLELSNEQMADLWLEVNPDVEAAVYFNKSNDLLVKCRGEPGPGTSFHMSPYQGRLDKCGVFLDDQHTRGTDLKFPIPSKACVTVGTRMKRDKLIQAVMRMRKLGQGHSVTFYLSHEAFGKVMSNSMDDDLTTGKVLDWVCKNTRKSNDDGLLYWALAGKNYAQRLAAEDHFHFPEHCNPSEVDIYGDPTFETKAGVLASQCVDDEIVKLKEMYGQYTQTELLSEIIPKWFAFAKAKLIRKNAGKELDARVMERFNEISSQIQEKIANQIPERQHVSANSGMMEEEQEKELELDKETEVEEERVVERPRKAEEVTPTLHRNVRNVILNGGPIEHGKGGIVRLCDMLRETTFWNEVQPECWGNEVWATNDFVSVIQGDRLMTYHKTDEHLRPIQYIVSCQSKSECGIMTQLLVLSPFEVNELMPYFRSGQVKSKLHMFSLRRTEKQDLLLNNRRLQMPSSMDYVTIPANGMASASLLLASGSLYFSGMKEQQAFVELLGIVPQPWSDEEKEWYQNGWITKNGFLLPGYRTAPQLGFQRDPTDLVKKILLCRHPVVSELTHIMRLLDDKRKIELTDV